MTSSKPLLMDDSRYPSRVVAEVAKELAEQKVVSLSQANLLHPGGEWGVIITPWISYTVRLQNSAPRPLRLKNVIKSFLKRLFRFNGPDLDNSEQLLRYAYQQSLRKLQR